MNEANRDVLASPVRVARIIFIVLMGTQVVYGWFAGRLAQGSEIIPISEALGGPAGKMFLIYAMVMLIVSFFLPNFLVRAAFNRAKQAGQKLEIKQFAHAMFVSMVIALALREGVSMMGLAGALTLKCIDMAYLLMPIGALSMLASWPSEERWAQVFESFPQKT